jgi:hypothetical protein
VLWLQSRLTRNQWARSGGIGAALAALALAGAIIVAVLTLLVAVAIGATVGKASSMEIMAAWLGLTVAFVFFWTIGLITELQRSEIIDLQRLMHLPVQLAQIFVVNYVASHAAVSVLFCVSASLGLAIGLALSRGPLMLLMFPLALSMVFMVTSWTYLLRGWLATLMSNPRKRRTIIMVLTGAFILVAQAPNLYVNVIRGGEHRPRRGESAEQREAREAEDRSEFQSLLEWQVVAPPLWVSAAARPLAEGRPFPALLGLIGCAGVGALGLKRAYESTVRFYQGATGGRSSAVRGAAAPVVVKRRTAARVRDRAILIERRLPGVPDQSAAVGLGTFQGMLRAPEIKMQWGSSFLVTLLVGAPLLFRSAANIPEAGRPFVATGIIVFSIFMAVGLVANQFGFDRDGFRAFVLSPVERWKILLGKNLAAFPAAAASAAILTTIVAVWIRLSPLAYLASLLQLAVAVMCAAMAGNLISILVPYRIQPGSMKPTKMPGLAMLLVVVCQLTLPIALAPAFIPALSGYLLEDAGVAPAAVINLLVSAALASVMVFVYLRTLKMTGRLLQRRETRILQTVSENVE